MLTDQELAAGLAEAGIPIIAIPEAGSGRRLAAIPLIQALLEHRDPLFCLSSIPLLLRRPEECLQAFDASCAPLHAHLYTAAVCLQRYWRTRLRLLGFPCGLPDRFSRALGLPDPDDHYGESCLREIFDRLENGRAGARIRGTDRMVARLVRNTFELALREARHAPAR